MKTNKLFYFASYAVLLFGLAANAQAPVLGTVADFVVFSAHLKKLGRSYRFA